MNNCAPNTVLHWVWLWNTIVTWKKLKLCYTHNLLCILISWHGWIIVHLQTLFVVPFHLFLVIISATLSAAFAAAAAAFATEAHGRGHHSVPGSHWVQGSGQKVPVAQDLRQEARQVRLHQIDNDRKDNQRDDGHANTDQDFPAGHRQAKYSQR